MNHTSKLIYSNAAIGQEDVVLHEIRQASKNIAILERDISHLNSELTQIMTKPVEFRKTGTAIEIRTALKAYFEKQFQFCPALLSDILKQLKQFKAVSGAESFRLLFTIVTTDMCRRFHTDINSLRLLCTYVGPGTLWLPDGIVNQKAFIAQRNKEQIAVDEHQIQQVAAGDVIILKGALYPEANPIVHRSPSVEEKGECRLLLRIDTNDSLNL